MLLLKLDFARSVPTLSCRETSIKLLLKSARELKMAKASAGSPDWSDTRRSANTTAAQASIAGQFFPESSG